MAEFRSLFNRGRAFAEELNGRGLVTYAASCAFYAFLSLFPMAALAASLLPCMGVGQAALLHFLGGVVPADVAALLGTILSNVYESAFPALPLSLLVLLWSSAQSFSELLKGMAAMIDPDSRTGYFKRRFRAVLLTLAMLTTMFLSLALLIFGARIGLLLGLAYPHLAGWLILLLRLRYPVMIVLLWLLFIFLYRSIPGQRLSFREVRTGAALSAAAWMLFSALFSVYAGRFLDLTLYGSMATMAVTMLWLFYCQYILLVGAGVCGRSRIKREAVPARTSS